MTDTELVLRARGGDELAFRRLVSRRTPMMRAQLGGRFAPGLTRDDLWQEALVGLHKAVRDYKPGRKVPFTNFAGLCIERQLINAILAARRAKHAPLNNAASFSQPAVGATDDEDAVLGNVIQDRSVPDPVDEIDRRRRLRAIGPTLERAGFTELERAALIGNAEGRTYEEVGEREGVDPKAVDNALQRARRKLSRVMEPSAA